MSFLMKIDGFVTKFTKKTWVLAPTLSKTMGAIASTAPILTRAMNYIRLRYIMSKFINSNHTKWLRLR